MKRITLATIKSFIRKNRENLFINVTSSFDGMHDCCVGQNGGWQKAEEDKTDSKQSDYHERTQRIKGAWFVGSSRDSFSEYNKGGYRGFSIYNSCGSFILAVKE